MRRTDVTVPNSHPHAALSMSQMDHHQNLVFYSVARDAEVISVYSQEWHGYLIWIWRKKSLGFSIRLICQPCLKNERANETSTLNPAASFSSDLDRPCGTALLLSQPCYFADGLEREHGRAESTGDPAPAQTHADAHPRVISGSRQDRCRSR